MSISILFVSAGVLFEGAFYLRVFLTISAKFATTEILKQIRYSKSHTFFKNHFSEQNTLTLAYIHWHVSLDTFLDFADVRGYLAFELSA